MSNSSTAVIIPNWNGADMIADCLNSVLSQTIPTTVIVVENGSVDQSDNILKTYGSRIVVLKQKKNLGFAGGVNVGIRYALEHNVSFIALLNNDAVAEKDWLEKLLETFKSQDSGIVTSKILIGKTNIIDSTGDWYSTTGMPFPRGRGEADNKQYDKSTNVFGGSGGASMYRAIMLKEIGLFDEDFFAYYEDVDISFRAQLYGWKAHYQPDAVIHHQLSATSSKHGYFAIKQSARNFWFIYVKNLPFPLIIYYLPSSTYRYMRMFAARIIKGGILDFSIGFLQAMILLPKKVYQRHHIQNNRKVSNEYIKSVIHHGKPPVLKV